MNRKKDEPVPQYLKVVNLLECVPGHEDRPRDGKPIAIIKFEHGGDIEHPLMLRMRDVKTLCVELLKVIKHHNALIPLGLLAELVPPTLYKSDRPKLPKIPRQSRRLKPKIVPSKRATMPALPMSNAEVEAFVRKLRRTRTKDELLRKLGLTQQEIDQQPKNGQRKGRK